MLTYCEHLRTVVDLAPHYQFNCIFLLSLTHVLKNDVQICGGVCTDSKRTVCYSLIVLIRHIFFI